MLAIPAVVAASGFYVASIAFPSLVFLFLGAVLVALSWGLLPKRARVPDQSLSAKDLPMLFVLLDQISDKLSAPSVQHVHISSEFNSGIFQARPRWGKPQVVLTIGLSLWESLDADERVALLAHDIGRIVSGDPRQGTVLGYALQALERWMFWFRPSDTAGDFGGLSFVGQVFNLLLNSWPRADS